MPEIKCNGCGGITNTVFCIYDFGDIEKGTSACALRWEDGEWVKGCMQDKNIGRHLKEYCQEIIENSHKRKLEGERESSKL